MSKFKKLKKFSLDNAVENTKFDFCRNLKWFLVAPLIIILIGIVLLCTLGFNLGLDFTGGTNMTIFIDSEGSYILKDEQNNLLAPTFDVNKDMGAIEAKVNDVLKEHGLKVATIQKFEYGAEEELSGSAVIIKFQNSKNPKDGVEAENEAIQLEFFKAFGYVKADVTELSEVENLNLVKNYGVTTASASAELMMKSFIALMVAIAIILVYVAIRFEITSGLAAILALFHDVLVTASVMLICRVQVNVAFIAALITILGYSINNTIIVFDRMRSDLKVAKNMDAKIDNNAIANNAVKGTMMRSILTGLTTFVMIFFITVIGVADIREFAFPIMVGILAGFYSSVFITPGLWAIAYRPRKKKTSSQNKNGKKKASEVVEVETV